MINSNKNISILERLKENSKEEIQEFINQFYNWQDVFKALGYDYVHRLAKNYIKSLDIDISHFNSEIRKAKGLNKFTDEELQEIISSVNNWKELCEKLNNKCCSSVKSQVIKRGLDYSHFNGNGTKKCDDELFIKTVNESSSFKEVANKLKVYKDINTIYNRVKYLHLSVDHFKKGKRDPSKKLIKSKSADLRKSGKNIPQSQLNKLGEIPREKIEEVVKRSCNWHDLLRNINFEFGTTFKRSSYKSLRNYIDKLQIDTSHFGYIKLENLFSSDELSRAIKKSYSWDEFYSNLGIKEEAPRVKSFYREEVSKLKIDTSHFTFQHLDINFTEEEFNKAFENASNWDEVAFNLGYSKSNGYLKSKIIERAADLHLDYSRLTLDRLDWNEEKFVKELNAYFNGEIIFIGPYKGLYEETSFCCKKHGEFRLIPYKFIRSKSGCPKCNDSKGESAIRNFFEKNNIKYERQKVLEGCRYKRDLRFDFYLEKDEKKYVVEFQGDQHFRPVKIFGMTEEKALENYRLNVLRDNIKKKYCENEGISMIEILNIEEIPGKLAFLL